MAMALKTNLVHPGVMSGIQVPECWSSTGLEYENLAESWEWEDPITSFPSRLVEGHLRPQSNSWVAAACSAVSLAAVGASKPGEFQHGYILGSGTHLGTSFSSGISDVAGGRRNCGADFPALVKNEPDEHKAEQVTVGKPVSLSGRKDGYFFSLRSSPSPKNEDRPAEEDNHTQPCGGQSSGSGLVNGGRDCQKVALKPGRRTHFENSAVVGQVKASLTAFSPPGKKQRALSPSTQIPRCQVQGCDADLSCCKDYHKRHKVCEMHSKAATAIAAGIEQRFCQQCSRFHVLKEFDEGKRSCRRRLAGHNQRRRKSQPETRSLFDFSGSFLRRGISTSSIAGSPFYIPDSKQSSFLHPHLPSSLEHGLHAYGYNLTRSSPWPLKSRDGSIPALQLQGSSSPVAAPYPSSGLILGGYHFLDGPLGSPGQGLSLSSSTGGVLGSLEQSRVGSCSQSLSSVSGLANSGRALSLLSLQSWASRPTQGASAPVSLGLSQADDSTLEQLVASSSDCSNRGSRFSHHLQLPCGGSSTSAQQQFDKQLSIQSGGLESVGLNCGLAATGYGAHHHQGSGNPNILAGFRGYYETNSTLSAHNGQDIQTLNSICASHHAFPTINLMQLDQPSDQVHQGTPYSHGLYLPVSVGEHRGFTDLRPFESSMCSSQHLL
ncbi:uncharacterized protein [Physcomitrium patens]|uniref:Squamosa promoter binding protein 3 n=1 Tax=Physcomitrium patens TaxID=3218 RepID=Q1MU26_PHYPA|nr:uncharacterized protein LOC112293436 isoform X2 [Physcomitrium patens]CAI91301.1 squamosa promoter binding protein 3 [Physcomitrium patens]|eukprot:XP_024398587.1 uncharacterized protein LOC112293436 isoform X2 [Physcomitrella patens]